MKAWPRNTSLVFWVVMVLSSASTARAQFRPALVGNGPNALINLIDPQKAARGRSDAMVMFSCVISPDGRALGALMYRASAHAKALTNEVKASLDRCRFLPALYNGKAVPIEFDGTAMLFMAAGTPHLRIFAHQNLDELKNQQDFIAPQLIWGTDDWGTAKRMIERGRTVLENGAVDVLIDVDTNGFVKGIKIVSERPRGYDYGAATVKEYQNARFIPGFRHGRAVSCNFIYTKLLRATPQGFLPGSTHHLRLSEAQKRNLGACRLRTFKPMSQGVSLTSGLISPPAFRLPQSEFMASWFPY